MFDLLAFLGVFLISTLYKNINAKVTFCLCKVSIHRFKCSIMTSVNESFQTKTAAMLTLEKSRNFWLFKNVCMSIKHVQTVIVGRKLQKQVVQNRKNYHQNINYAQAMLKTMLNPEFLFHLC